MNKKNLKKLTILVLSAATLGVSMTGALAKDLYTDIYRARVYNTTEYKAYVIGNPTHNKHVKWHPSPFGFIIWNHSSEWGLKCLFNWGNGCMLGPGANGHGEVTYEVDRTKCYIYFWGGNVSANEGKCDNNKFIVVTKNIGVRHKGTVRFYIKKN